MHRIVTSPQTSDMGSGLAYIELDKGTNLYDILNWIEHNINAWGTITIINNKDEIIRKFDYDTYGKDIQFYHNIDGFYYKTKIQKAYSKYCFMNEDFYLFI